MHPNPIFHTESAERNLAFARARAFGVLAVNGADGPMMAHVPFLIDEDGAQLHLHLVRSNPIARALKAPMQARSAVSGADGYISPDWYGVPDQVPTWNYVAVHLTGVLERPGRGWLGRDLSAVMRGQPSGVMVYADPMEPMARAQAVIDFTAPNATVEFAALAAQARGGWRRWARTGKLPVKSHPEELERRRGAYPACGSGAHSKGSGGCPGAAFP